MDERSIRPVWIGTFLVALGAGAIAWCPYELGVKIGEAVLVAGILSVTVDLYLKHKLQEEAARDIFHYILGLKLPEELGNNLLAFASEKRVYRKDVVLGVEVQSTSEGVSITIEPTAKVVAARKATYEQVLLFEESARPTGVSASLTSSKNASINYSRTDIQLKPKADE